MSQIACGDTDSGLFTLEMCLDLRGKTFGSESEKWAEVAYDLRIAKGEAGLFEDAVALLDKFILLQRGLENSDERLSTALLSLGKIYLKQRRVDDAMACFEEALCIRKQKSDNELDVSEVFESALLETLIKKPLSSIGLMGGSSRANSFFYLIIKWSSVNDGSLIKVYSFINSFGSSS